MSARMTHGVAFAAALLIAWPVMAQQNPSTDPHHPGGAGPAASGAAPQAPATSAPAAPAPGGGMGMMGMMGGQGGMPMMMGRGEGAPGMGMMGGQGGMPMMMGRGEGGPGMGMMGGGASGPGMMRRHGAYGSPMNVIINVGPGIHVDVEDDDGRRGMGQRRMRRDGMPGMMSGGMPMREMSGGPAAGMGPGGAMADRLHEMLAERVEGGLAFLRAELQVRPDQDAAWNTFSARIREAAERFRAGRERLAMPPSDAGLDQRLAFREARLTAELERIRACREATAGLLPALDEAQRRTVETLSWLIIPGVGPGPMARAMDGQQR